MKATGIVRRVDELGRIVIPKEICRVNGILPGTPVEFFIDGDTVIIRKFAYEGKVIEAAKLIYDLVNELPPTKSAYIRELAGEIIDELAKEEKG